MRAAGGEVDLLGIALTRLAPADRAVSRPQVAQQQRNLIVGEGEHCRRQALFVRPLTKDAEILQPLADTKGRPAVAVAADDQLVPGANWGLIAGHATSERFGGAAYGAAVLFGSGRVTQRLVHQITALANQMTQQHEPVSRPTLRLHRFRQAARECEALTRLECAHGCPACSGQQPVFRGRPNRPAAGELHFAYRAATHFPDRVGSRTNKTLLFVNCPDFGLRPHQTRDRHATPVGQAYQRLPGHAFTQIRHNRFLVLALLDRTVQLRERNHRHLQFLGQHLQSAGDLRNFRGAVFLRAGYLHELQVIHHHQIQAMLALHAARTGA